MLRRDRAEERRVKFEAVVRPLLERGVLEPLADRDDDAQHWSDCDLCSYVENRLHHALDPAVLTPDQRTAWSSRALGAREHLYDLRGSSYMAAFWLLDRGVRAGTIALSKHTFGDPTLPIFSLYVIPAHRASGLAYRALRAIDQAAVAAGFDGIRIGTFWTWQTAVRRYLLRYGMWAYSFKRSIEFVWAGLPPHHVEVSDHAARFSIAQGAGQIELLSAARSGDRLIWNESPAMTSDRRDAFRYHARPTFALALAVHGWPLLRAGDDLEKSALYDVGGPAVLAHKIAVFEAIDRRCGFDVQTPRIPGLPYDAIAAGLAS